jgi:hypothetical protein
MEFKGEESNIFMIIEINIEDIEILEYLENVRDEELDNKIEGLIKLGICVGKLTNMNLNIESGIIEPLNKCVEGNLERMYNKIETIFENNPMNSQMDALNTTIEDFKGKSKTPILKGQIGENCISETIQRYFPECELRNTTKEPNQADFHFIMEDCPTILLEIKTYKTNIPTEQISKFRRDLRVTGYKYGIMVSTVTGISKKSQFAWDIEDDIMVVYLPNSGFDGYSVMWGILFIKEINKYKDSEKSIQKGYEISNKLESLKSLIIDIENTKSIINRTKYNLINNINTSFGNLDTEILNIEHRIKSFIKYFN